MLQGLLPGAIHPRYLLIGREERVAPIPCLVHPCLVHTLSQLVQLACVSLLLDCWWEEVRLAVDELVGQCLALELLGLVHEVVALHFGLC